MNVNAILACDLNFGIGKDGDLPWPKSKEDMKWFREHTSGGVVLMGRITWESIGSKPLADRTNIVVSSRNLQGPAHTAAGDMKDILEEVKQKYPEQTIWIMGGANIYEQAFPYCDKFYLTIMKKQYSCDTYIESNLLKDFTSIEYFTSTDELSFQIRGR